MNFKQIIFKNSRLKFYVTIAHTHTHAHAKAGLRINLKQKPLTCQSFQIFN